MGDEVPDRWSSFARKKLELNTKSHYGRLREGTDVCCSESAFGGKADILLSCGDVSFYPGTDVRSAASRSSIKPAGGAMQRGPASLPGMPPPPAPAFFFGTSVPWPDLNKPRVVGTFR
jgi:hypothetical protein